MADKPQSLSTDDGAQKNAAEKSGENNGDGPKKLVRRWSAPTHSPRTLSNKIGWVLVALSTLLVFVLAVVIYRSTSSLDFGDSNPARLSATEHISARDGFALRPPAYWHIQDHVPLTSIVFKGPHEDGFNPIVIVSCVDAQGRLSSHVQEHKARVSAQDKFVVWLSEELDQGIDGCQAMRLEYDCQLPREQPKAELESGKAAPAAGDLSEPLVKIRTLQYILEDPAVGERPARFYRVTCHVAEHAYTRYLPRFEACARSFRRLPR